MYDHYKLKEQEQLNEQSGARPYSTRFFFKGVLFCLWVVVFFSWVIHEVDKRPGNSGRAGVTGGVVTIITTPTPDNFIATQQAIAVTNAHIAQAQAHAQATKEHTLLILEIAQATRIAGEAERLTLIKLEESEAKVNEMKANTQRLNVMWYVAAGVLLMLGLCTLCAGFAVGYRAITATPTPLPLPDFKRGDIYKPPALVPLHLRRLNGNTVPAPFSTVLENGAGTVQEVAPAPALVQAVEPDAEMRAFIRQRYQVLGSKTAVCRELWGYKNARNLAWVDLALQEAHLPMGEGDL